MQKSDYVDAVAGNETARLQEMQSFDLEGLAGDAELKSITDFAAALCNAPTALVSFVEADRQWFPARTGLDASETPRSTSFCAHAMYDNEIMVVPDAALDARFATNPLVTGEPFIRFYAGAPLVTRDGWAIGALCAIDREPRPALTSVQRQGLQVLAANVMTMLTLRRSTSMSTRETREQESMFRVLADAMPQMVWSTRADGFHDYYNARWYEFTGMPVGSTDGEAWNGMFHPEDQDRAWAAWRHSLETGAPYEIEYRLRNAEGDYRWTLGRALPIRDQDGAITRWFGTCTDIHDHKLLEGQRAIVAQELSHRIKNIFAVISGLISYSVRHRPELSVVADDLRSRIMALSRAHDFVRPHSDASRPTRETNSLIGMLAELLAPYGDRISVSIDDARIDDRSATPLALVFHELATNAAKYGALSTDDGRVEVTSRQDNENIVLEWREVGGPLISAPAKEGFGSKLMHLSATAQLNGRIDRNWSGDGLVVKLAFPAAALFRA